MDREISTLVISEYEEDEAVNAFELGYFLYFFRSAYVACLDYVDKDEIILDRLSEVSRDYLISLIVDEASRLWMRELPPEFDLEFISISKHSPLKFVSKAAGKCLVALTMAVIISGGKANIYTGQFELPPLATGIRELKDVFDQTAPRELPSERKERMKNEQGFPKPRG